MTQYHLLPLDGAECDQFSTGGSAMVSGIVQALQTIRNNDALKKNTPSHIAIVSTCCIRECLILQSVIQRHNVSAVVLSLKPSVYNSPLEVVPFMPPTITLADALFVWSRSLLWNRLGLITDHADTFTIRLADYLKYRAKQKNMIISPAIESHFNLTKIKNVETLLQLVEESGVKVIILLTQEAPQILCAAHHRGMVWPHYGWLLYGSSSPDIKQLPTCRGSHRYLEGTVFPIYYSSLTTKASLEETAIQLVSKASTAATQLHIDLKSALLRMTIPGIPGNLTFHNIQHDIPAVYFIQVRNGTATSVATVHNDTVLVNRWLQEEELPRGTLPVRVNTVYPTWLGALEITVSGTLITITLVLYVYYRKEPEIHATSWTLSLLMILGCYLVLVYLILLTLDSVVLPIPSFDLCSFLVWMSGLGLSYTLILAVLLVKLVRIYRIFYHYSHVGKFCSDMALVVYVLLLLSPSILVLTAITILKPYKWSIKTTTHTDHTEVLHVCTGDLGSYLTALTCYIIVLIMCIAFAAIKTRKLSHQNFRDAKKVNVFLFLILPTGIFGLVLFKISSDSGQYLSAYISLHVTHCALIGLCLGFLFFPKLHPIVYRKYFIPMKLKFVKRSM